MRLSAPSRPAALIADLVAATRILINENVLDVFGHVAFRDPADPAVFWMALAGAPARLAPEDVVAFDLSGAPLVPTEAPLFSERYLHAAVFGNRPDLHASCHHHAEALMPYCLGARTLGAVSQTGGWMGAQVPVWDSRTKFGDTSLVVTDLAQAKDLVSAMGAGTIVLLRGHGTLVVGSDLREMTFRAVHACRDARVDTLASSLGPITTLSAGEIAFCQNIAPPAVSRSWEHWIARLTAHAATTRGSLP